MAVIALFAVSTTANAEFRFGIKAGLNVDKLHLNEDVFESGNRCGFTGGVMAEFTVPIIGVGADLSVMYTRMNSRLSPNYPGDFVSPLTDGVSDGDTKQHGRDFIEIPLNLKYKINIPVVASIIKPYVFTGPTFAFRLGSDTFKDMKTKTCQVAWNVGLGLELVKHLQVGASYGFGINNIAKTVVNAEEIKVKNNYWTITAAYLF